MFIRQEKFIIFSKLFLSDIILLLHRKIMENIMESKKKLKDEQMRSVLFEYYESRGERMRFFEEF